MHSNELKKLFSGYGRRDVVEFLLANGASVQARDDGGIEI